MIAMISLSHAQVPQIINYQGRVAVGTPPVNFDGTGQFKFALVNGGGLGWPATATATISSGRVTAITVTIGGFGYLTPPVVTISPLGGGSGAAATANVINGVVSSITVTNQGSGYIVPPFITVAAPPTPVYWTYWSNDGTGILGQQPTAAVSLAVSKGLYSVLLGDTTLANMTAIPSAVFGNSDVRLRVWFNDGGNGFQLLSPDQRLAAVGYALMAAGVPAGAIGATQLAEGAVTSSKLAAGAVGSSQLSAGAVQTANIAANAITASQLAPGAVTFSGLAKPPQSGGVAGTALAFEFGQAFFNVTFPQPFAATPVVTLSLAPGGAAFQPDTSLVVTAASAAQFSGRMTTFNSIETIPDSGGNVGLYSSLARVSNSQAIAYYDSTDGNLKYVFASEVFGRSWNPPVTVDSAGDVGLYPSMIVVNSRPAIAYYDATNGDLRFVRANDASGTAWGTPQTLDGAATVGLYPSLAIVNGNPAIAYYDATNRDLKYMRANDASGTTWGTPLIVDTLGGEYPSLTVVNGSPAIAHHQGDFFPENEKLRYVRATNANGTAWGSPLVLDTDAVGEYPTLIVADGNPAISYFDQGKSDLKYVRAADASGAAWNTPLILDGTIAGAAAAGRWASMGIHDGFPVICYEDSGNHRVLKFIRATNASGTAWGAPVFIPGRSGVLLLPSLDAGPGFLHLSCYDYANGDLNYIRPVPPSTDFQINWIALPP
jgi:hypothetical protein